MREPTDEEVERALKRTSLWPTIHHDDSYNRHAVREMLRVAFNPPPEPHIEVTQEMAKVGADVVCRYWLDLTSPDAVLFSDLARETFLAMERVRPRDPS